MSSVQTISPNADTIGKANTLTMNIAAAKGLQNILKTNLGPKGTMKMLVSGAGDIKLTKDGQVLLSEMQIQHPTAAIIARTATAQDDVTGDGTTSNVLFTAELLKQSERYLAENVHPRVLAEGIELGREFTLGLLEQFKIDVTVPLNSDNKESIDLPLSSSSSSSSTASSSSSSSSSTATASSVSSPSSSSVSSVSSSSVSSTSSSSVASVSSSSSASSSSASASSLASSSSSSSSSSASTSFKSLHDLMVQTAATSLRTKVPEDVADVLTPIIVDSVQVLMRDTSQQHVDLHMVEIMHMKQMTSQDTKFIDGLVLDHGARHPNMPKRCENCHILVCNVSLEYEKTEVTSGFYYKTAEERAKLALAERKVVNDLCEKLVAFKKQVCKKDENFIVINQKGIDPISLDILQKANIVALRRAKRRNMERIPKACGGYAVNSFEGLAADCLGYAKLVYEHTLGEDKFTFIEGCPKATSCTILVRGPTDHAIRQVKDAIHDGLRAVANILEDGSIVPGAGAFELFAHQELLKYMKKVSGRTKIGVQIFADALLVIPKTLAENSGLDVQSVLIDCQDEVAKGHHVGVDVYTGKPILPEKYGIWDNFRVKKSFLHLGTMVAVKLLLVDEVIRAGKRMGGDKPSE
eukprot:TRINITY_DN8910_c0_g1_i1.p1 TRINITY_DN8910_c0_g1~~TRINITY_DN8910_c0_g1_i1.p1  ORF type:complete len:637 (-),score=203.94 TRINITY_DN8910_c0_g1_i1:128-2038(-)